MISRQCDYCQVEYQAEARYLNRGQGRFCSRSCSSRAQTRVRPNTATCAYCGITFNKPKSSIASSKSGLVFCSRKHKDLAQRIGGLKEIQPSHYGGSKSDYREVAFDSYPAECCRCGYSNHPEILEVNHKDCDRKNNSADNLEILCPNCHAEFHFLTRTGKWRVRDPSGN